MIKVNPEFTQLLVKEFGTVAQLGTLAEEGLEFSKEFLKYLFRSDKNKYWRGMESEFADILVMVDQAKEIFDMDVVYIIMKQKLDRLCERLEKDGIEHPIAYMEVI